MIKIVVTGPESTGKTTLAEQLAAHFQTLWVQEYARIYIDNLHRAYEESDLLTMAKGQLASEEVSIARIKRLMICDTSLEVLKVWSEEKYKQCHPWIIEKLKKQKVDLYLLCAPDIPWEDDPQRENPEDRERLYTIYQKELAGQKVVEIWGGQSDRLQSAIQAIEFLLR